MTGTVFIDSNVPMYLIGADHPLKYRARDLIEEFLRRRLRLVTSAEVLQEICHRYVAIDRREFLQPAFDAVYGIVDQVYQITEHDVAEAKSLLLGYQKLSARDALHAALMRNLGLGQILSFDADFDHLPWLTRLS